jgi:hypothetical protein
MFHLDLRAAPSNEEILGLAASGKEQRLAFEDPICIMDARVRLCDAIPIGSVAEPGLRDL